MSSKLSTLYSCWYAFLGGKAGDNSFRSLLITFLITCRVRAWVLVSSIVFPGARGIGKKLESDLLLLYLMQIMFVFVFLRFD